MLMEKKKKQLRLDEVVFLSKILKIIFFILLFYPSHLNQQGQNDIHKSQH